MRKLFVAMGFSAALFVGACDRSNVPPPTATTREVANLPVAAEQSARVLCRAYILALRGVTTTLRSGRLNASQRASLIAATDRANLTLDPACHGNITSAALTTVTNAMNEWLGAQAQIQGVSVP